MTNKTHADAASPAFKIFIVCESARSFGRAMQLKENISQPLRGLFEITANFCCFDWLKCPKLGSQAAGSAAAANMVVFIAEESAEIPEGFEQWMDRLPAATTKSAFAVFTNPRFWQSDARPPLDHIVHSCARARQADFITNCHFGQDDSPALTAPSAKKDRLTDRKNHLSASPFPVIPKHPRQSCNPAKS